MIKLDPQSKLFLDAMNSHNGPSLEMIPVDVLRAGKSPYGYESRAAIASIENIVIPGSVGDIPLRMYFPRGEGPFPVFVTFHGGGWVLGNLESHDGICRELCNLASCIVVSVDYHRAPEYKFPTPLNDCYTATEWVVKNIGLYRGNSEKIVIGGDSAGGNLAAAVTIMAREKQSFSLLAQVLVYPALNYNFGTDSYRIYQDGYGLTLNHMKWFWGLYTQDENQANNPHVSPLCVASFYGLPQALIIVAEFDPLRDDGLMYAKKLSQANVSVTKTIYPTIHGFVSFADRLHIGRQATEDIASYLRKIFVC